jgi:hypothetical protein
MLGLHGDSVMELVGCGDRLRTLGAENVTREEDAKFIRSPNP